MDELKAERYPEAEQSLSRVAVTCKVHSFLGGGEVFRAQSSSFATQLGLSCVCVCGFFF